MSCSPHRISRSGFTLVELLAVIGIILILVALTFPVLGSFQARAGDAKCVSNLRQIGAAINLYANDHDDRLPGPMNMGISPRLVANQRRSLVYHLQPYLNLPEPTGEPYFSEIFLCGGELLTTYVLYSSNDMPPAKRYLMDMRITDSTGREWPVGPWGRRDSDPPTPSWKRINLSGQLDLSKVDEAGNPPTLAKVPAIYETDGRYPPHGKASWPWPVPPEGSHRGHMNVLYFDWHVAKEDPWAFSSKRP